MLTIGQKGKKNFKKFQMSVDFNKNKDVCHLLDQPTMNNVDDDNDDDFTVQRFPELFNQINL
jgi:hypothetical protein